MPDLSVLSASEQVAAYLREELRGGAWTDRMPGSDRLAAELGIGRDTAEAALRQLEREGVLVNQGRRRGRRIEMAGLDGGVRRLRVGLLLGEQADRRHDYVIETRQRLGEAGHEVFYPAASLVDLHMEVGRVARLVEKAAADAWVVMDGSREVLEWFAARPAPVFALFGRRTGLPIAGIGPDKQEAMTAATRALLSRGHHRIALVTRASRRLPEPGQPEQAFLDELTAHGVVPSAYHLPDWTETAAGFHSRLGTLFRVTPPTALILDEESLLVAALGFCAHRGIRVPEDLSIICSDAAPTFAWYQPSIAHIQWDGAPVARRIARWAGNVARGRRDVRQGTTAARFVEGGTLAPAPKQR
jgi:DNA-binding LacI/PurR family transcriptional regulator